jgi:hypothetical protein
VFLIGSIVPFIYACVAKAVVGGRVLRDFESEPRTRMRTKRKREKEDARRRPQVRDVSARHGIPAPGLLI